MNQDPPVEKPMAKCRQFRRFSRSSRKLRIRSRILARVSGSSLCSIRRATAATSSLRFSQGSATVLRPSSEPRSSISHGLTLPWLVKNVRAASVQRCLISSVSKLAKRRPLLRYLAVLSIWSDLIRASTMASVMSCGFFFIVEPFLGPPRPRGVMVEKGSCPRRSGGPSYPLERPQVALLGQSSRFQPVAQLDNRRRVPLATGRARYLASVQLGRCLMRRQASKLGHDRPHTLGQGGRFLGAAL